MWRLLSATLRYRWWMVALGWAVAIFTAFQLALSKKETLPLTLGFALVVASAIVGGLIPDLERRDHRNLIMPLLAIGRRQVAYARALTPMAMLVVGAAAGVGGSLLGYLVLGQVLDADRFLAPVLVAAQLAPFVQLTALIAEMKIAHAEARERTASLAACALGGGFAITLLANLSGLLARWATGLVALVVGAALTLLASVLHQRRISFAE